MAYDSPWIRIDDWGGFQNKLTGQILNQANGDDPPDKLIANTPIK